MSGFARSMTPAMVVAIVVLVFSAVGLTAVIRTSAIHLKKLPIQPPDNLQLHSLPTEYPSWIRQGADKEMSAEAEEELGTTNYLSRAYRERNPPAGRRAHIVELHLAYYTGMIDTVPHVPERCLVAGGWIQDGSPRLVGVPLDLSRMYADPDVPESVLGGPVMTSRSLTTFGPVHMPMGVDALKMRISPFRNHRGDAYFAGYFFVANGGTVPSADDIRLLAFSLKEDYAYYAKIQFTSGTVGSAEELAEVTASMLDEMLPDIMLRMPDWVEVREGRYPEGDRGNAR